jgi:hypothetical protein
MAARRAFLPNPQLSEGQRQVVVDDNKFVDRRVESFENLRQS